jgi:hypothetical protein
MISLRLGLLMSAFAYFMPLSMVQGQINLYSGYEETRQYAIGDFIAVENVDSNVTYRVDGDSAGNVPPVGTPVTDTNYFTSLVQETPTNGPSTPRPDDPDFQNFQPGTPGGSSSQEVLASSGGSVTGYHGIDDGNQTLTASANSGYLFSHWSGDFNSTDNPIKVIINNNNFRIQANFTQDFNDDDNDSLNNFLELVTYGSAIDNNDTDGDGITDGDEVELGFSPTVSNSLLFDKILNALKKNPSTFEIYDSTELENAKKLAVNNVISNPSIYNLVTETFHKQVVDDLNLKKAEELKSLETATISNIISNPSVYNFVKGSTYDKLEEILTTQNSKYPFFLDGWFYLPGRGWIYTNDDAFPFIYSESDNNWFYIISTNDGVLFYNYSSKQWHNTLVLEK